jgi:CrcB protein
MSGLVPADVVALGMGAFLGALSRYQCGRLATDWIAKDPHRLGKLTGWHTAGINMGGSFLLGGISAMPVVDVRNVNGSTATSTGASSRRPSALWQGLSPRTKLMMGVGFCGSYTTFSTYSVDVVTWISEGKTGKALKYVAANNVGGFMAAAAGMMVVKKFCG